MNTKVLWTIAAGAALAPCVFNSSNAQITASVIEGRLTMITNDKITVDGVYTYQVDRTTRCFDPYKVELTCGSLAGVGYADKARLTLLGDVVKRVDILELQQ